MNFLRFIHTALGLVVFTVLFLLFFPVLCIPILFPSLHRLVGIVNRWWAHALFRLSLLPYEVICETSLNRNGTYVFCPNHFSYLDIPAMGLNPVNAIFVGKSAMEKIPLFGFMYRKLHITFDRSSLISKFNTFKQSVEALEQGKSLVIFPEGGMVTHHAPRMGRFKDGAFRAAIEKQIPIVPVTIPNNWIILPDASTLRLHRGLVKVIFHRPIATEGLTLADVDKLKKTVFNVIDQQLTHEHRSRYSA
ncbi:MAG: lysophospholipid acyltransferase family protein [Cyclobacteriaceae bacterium]